MHRMNTSFYFVLSQTSASMMLEYHCDSALPITKETTSILWHLGLDSSQSFILQIFQSQAVIKPPHHLYYSHHSQMLIHQHMLRQVLKT